MTTETPDEGFVKSDGTFIENWQLKLQDESLHADKTLMTLKNVENLAKSYVHVRRQVPLDKIAIPNENSTDADWEVWHKAGGRPETAADYALKRPDDFPEEYYSDELANTFMDFAHKIGLSTKQVNALFEFNNNNVLAVLKADADTAELDMNELKDGLYKDWGNAFEQKKHFGNLAVEKGTSQTKMVNGIATMVSDEKFKSRLTKKFGNDPDFIRFTSNLGSKFAESGAVESQVPTPTDIQTKIDELMHTDAYRKRDHPNHKNIVQQVARLFREKAKSTKTG